MDRVRILNENTGTMISNDKVEAIQISIVLVRETSFHYTDRVVVDITVRISNGNNTRKGHIET